MHLSPETPAEFPEMAQLAHMLDPCHSLATRKKWNLCWSSLVLCHPTGQADGAPSREPHQQSGRRIFGKSKR